MSVLQIRRGNRDNLGISLLIRRNIHCDPSLELSGQDSSNEGHNICFLLTLRNYLRIIPVTPSYLELCYMTSH